MKGKNKMSRSKNFISMLSLVFLIAVSLTLSGCIDLEQKKESKGELKSEVKEYGKGYRFTENGWVYVHIEGEAYERGKQHGYLVAEELKEIKKSLEYLTMWNTGKEFSFFVENAERLFAGRIDEEFIDEIKGIADGAREAGTDMSWQEVLAWNGYEELTGYWWPNEEAGKFAVNDKIQNDHCSAFMATAPYAKYGKIVMGHNSFSGFEFGQYLNLILDIKPDNGHRIFMQSSPGYIDSMADFFVTDAGIMGTETTIGGYSLYDPNEDPEFFRIRKAMQYGGTLDEYVEIMKKKNNGGYANSWLLADINTGEIMRYELGLQYSSVEKKKDGYFIGFNAPIDPKIRNLETSNSGYADIRRHQGARQVRLMELMEEYKDKIDVKTGEKIMADHYDVYLKKDNNPSSRTVDGHYELDDRAYMSQIGRPLPYQPRGAVDGKVMDSDMARSLQFAARWGNSSGMAFDADKFLEEHIQWDYLKGYLKDRPSMPWTIFKAGEK